MSEIVRDAGTGACTIVTVNRKPLAMIGPLPAAMTEATEIGEAEIMEPDDPPPSKDSKPLSDAATFRKAIFSAPYTLELDF